MISSVKPSLKNSCSGSLLMFTKGRTAMEGLSGNGKTIFSLEADSNLGEGGDTGFETFSGKEGAPFWGGEISTAIFPVSGTSIEGGGTADDFSCWREAIFSLGATSG